MDLRAKFFIMRMCSWKQVWEKNKKESFILMIDKHKLNSLISLSPPLLLDTLKPVNIWTKRRGRKDYYVSSHVYFWVSMFRIFQVRAEKFWLSVYNRFNRVPISFEKFWRVSHEPNAYNKLNQFWNKTS